MSQISVISKLTGVETTTEGTQVTLSHSSIVELHVERADVSHFARSGNDLVVTLHSGEVITLKNFYVTDAEGVSQLVWKRVTVRCGGLKILPGLLPTNLSPPRTYYWRPQAVIPVAQPSGHGYSVVLLSQAGSLSRQAAAAEGVATMMMTIRTPARRAILPIRIPHRQMRLPTFNSPQMVKLSQVLLNPAVRLR